MTLPLFAPGDLGSKHPPRAWKGLSLHHDLEAAMCHRHLRSTVGRFAWVLADIRRTEPVVFRGRQGLIDVPCELVRVLEPASKGESS